MGPISEAGLMTLKPESIKAEKQLKNRERMVFSAQSIPYTEGIWIRQQYPKYDSAKDKTMKTNAITPILNVSNFQESIEWFEKLGWEKKWDWGEPPTFGAVCSSECEIFLCLDAQGGRGKGDNTSTFSPGGSESSDKGVWMSVWVDDVDAVHQQAIEAGIEVVFSPQDMPWGVRECHIRHPDGHVFRVTRSITQ